MALTKIGFTLIKDNFKDAVSGSSSEQSSSFSTRVTDLNLSLSGSTTLISGSAISTGSFGAANIAGMSVSNLVDFSSSIASRVTDEESDFTATGISGSWQGVIGSGSLGMVSGSAISTGSFGRVIVAEMGNSDLTDVSSSISTRVNLLEGSGSITESSASFSERVNLLEGSGSIFESSASFSERVNLLEGSGSINDLVTASGSFSTRVSDLKTDSGSFSTRVTTAEASGALFDGDGVVTFAGATITGTLTAQEVHTEFISASVTVSTGSNIFGDETGDVHQFTGSIETSGSIILDTLGGNVSGSVVSTGSFGAANIAGMTVSNLIDVSSSLSSRLTDVKTESGSFAAASSSYSSASGSFSTRVSDLKTDSGSFSTRVSDLNLSLSGSTSLISGSVTSTGSFGSVVAGGTGVNSFTGNVGIDTNNPLAPLHISKDVTQVSSSAESKTQAGLYLNFDPTAGSNSVTMFALSSSVATAGSYGIQVANSTGTGQYPFVINPYGGNVGIGTTAPANALDVSGSVDDAIIYLNAPSGVAQLKLDSGANTNAGINLREAGTSKWSIFNDGDASDKLIIEDDGDIRMTIQQDGNVGIGTTAPSTSLMVQNGTSTPEISLFHDSGTNQGIGRLVFYTDGTGTKESTAHIELRQESGGGGNRKGEIAFAVSDGGAPAVGAWFDNNCNLQFANGKGVQFAAKTPDGPTMSSEILDDYEEGTWTVTVTGDNGNYVLSGTEETGAYTKIGDLVHAQGGIQINSLATTDPVFSGNIKFSLPFTSGNFTDLSERSFGSVWLVNTGETNSGHMVAVVTSAQAFFNIGQVADGGANTYLTKDHVDTAWFLGFQITYKV